MKHKRVSLTLAVVVTASFIALVCNYSVHRDQTKVVLGKPVSYWLTKLPTEAHGLIPADNPLVEAGPEIIPQLIVAAHRSYATEDFVNRHRGLCPRLLQKYLPDPSPPGRVIREAAAFRIGWFGSVASNAVPSLLELLSNNPAFAVDQGRVIQALGNIGPAAEPAVPILVKYLSDTNEWIRMTACYSLLQIGKVPREAVRALKKNLGDTGYVAALMAVALWVAEPDQENVSRIGRLLVENGDGNTRPHVAAALGFSEQVPAEVRSTLLGMLGEGDPSVRQGAAIGLARPHAEHLERIIKVLTEGLESGQFQVRCAESLGRIGPGAASSKPYLEEATGYVLRCVAKDSLARITVGSSEPGSAANVRQPFRLESNLTSSTAASRR